MVKTEFFSLPRLQAHNFIRVKPIVKIIEKLVGFGVEVYGWHLVTQ